MDIERLNKFQIVLLTLLISFVTSIATGIVTVSLMDQAPPVIPQTINRVVERTVERVVPHETQTATVITTEKTVVIKESDLIAQAIARVRPSIVRVHGTTADGEADDFIARGFVIAEGHAVVPLIGIDSGVTYTVLIGKETIPGEVIKIDAKKRLALIALGESEGEYTPAAVLGTNPVTLGQTVIAVVGDTSIKVAMGIVTATNDLTIESGDTIQSSFETDIPNSKFVPGSTLLNTDGAVIGMFVDDVRIVPTSILTSLLKALKSNESKADTATTTRPTS
jgi:hypothetical protein